MFDFIETKSNIKDGYPPKPEPKPEPTATAVGGEKKKEKLRSG